MRSVRSVAALAAMALALVLPAPMAAAAETLGPPSSVSVSVASSNVAFGQGRITATWSPVDGALGYAVSARAGGVVVTSTTVSAPLTSATVTGLTGGIAYDIVVQTANVEGFGGTSSPVQATALTVPATPTVNSVVVSSGNTLVTWSEPNNGGAAITAYTITQTPTGTSYSNVVDAEYTFSGDTYASPSDYTVTATNSVGTSGSGDTGPNTPSAPQSVAATVAAGVITATWVAPKSTGGSTITGYTATLTNGGSLVATRSVSTLTAAFEPVEAGTYRLQVTAANANGSGSGSDRIAVEVTANGGGGSPGGTSSGGGSGSGSGGTSAGGSTPSVAQTPANSTGGSSNTSGPSASVPPARPTGRAPARLTAVAGQRTTLRLTNTVAVVARQLVVRATSRTGKMAVLKSSGTRKGAAVTIQYVAPSRPGSYKLQVLQRTATGLTQVARTVLVVRTR